MNNKKKKIMQKKEGSISSLWDNFKRIQHLHHRGARRRREQNIGNLYEKSMKENFPDLVKEIDMQVQEAQRVPSKMDAKRSSPARIIVKMPKVKDKDRI